LILLHNTVFIQFLQSISTSLEKDATLAQNLAQMKTPSFSEIKAKSGKPHEGHPSGVPWFACGSSIAKVCFTGRQ